MPESLEQIRNQLNEYFQSLDKKQKIKMSLSALFILISMTALILYFTRPQYVVLHNNLSAREAGEVINILDSNNIKARLDTSSIVMVPRKDLEKSQVVLATQGIPSDSISEDLFVGSSFMQTSEDRARDSRIKKQNYLRMTIEQIPGIDRAVVNLSIPERTGFVLSNDVDNAKASVYLALNRNSLDNHSVEGIVSLVANAVPGLTPENVTVHGTDGRILNPNRPGGSEFANATEQLSLQQVVKNDLEKSITDFLATVYGYGNVAVMANVKLDFNSEVMEIREFSPPIEGENEGIVRSMQTLDSMARNGGVDGIPGTDTNTEDPAQYAELDSSTSTYTEASRTINYEINEVYRKIVKANGQIQDITVAVFINMPEENFSDEERRELTNMISTASGLDTRVVQVAAREFSTSAQENWQSIFDDMNLAGTRTGMPLWSLILLAFLILGIGYFGFNAIAKRKKEELLEPAFNEPIPSQVFEEIDLELSGSEVKQQLERLVNKKPDAVAQLLKNWLSED